MKKRYITLIVIASVLIIGLIGSLIAVNLHTEEIEGFKKIESEAEYENIFSGKNYEPYYGDKNIFLKILTLPVSLLDFDYLDAGPIYYNGMKSAPVYDEMVYDLAESESAVRTFNDSAKGAAVTMAGLADDADYSRTNVQVENVDEGDQLKTDGKFIYTITNDKVNVVDATNDKALKKVVTLSDGYIPEDLLLGNNKLAVIGRAANSYEDDTMIVIYSMPDFKIVKTLTIEGRYETSRLIGERLVVVTDKYEDYYDYPIYRIDNNDAVNLDYSKIFFNEKYHDYGMTYVASLDLSSLDNINVYGVSTYSDTVYASEKSLYLIKTTYGYDFNEDVTCLDAIKSILGYKGLFGIATYDEYDYSYGPKTKIVKLSFDDNNEISIKAHTLVKGQTVNQFSFDEKDEKLRLALYNTEDENSGFNNVTSVVVLDKSLNEIGRLGGLAEGERIYATRFIGDRLYLVTYKNMDPLFVIDLKDNNPKLLGELKIPGYSTYLHPYDDNHIIGIGVDTEVNIDRDAFGRVLSEWSTQTGLKMALFDVTDVANPKEISKVTIGDSNTTSDILENHKALLFSREKGLLAIPVRQYTYYRDEIKSYTDEEGATDNGFAVYNIDLVNGITLRGNVFHENIGNKWYKYSSNEVRGMYIKDDLFTISNDYIKVNKLDTLKEVSRFIFD